MRGKWWIVILIVGLIILASCSVAFAAAMLSRAGFFLTGQPFEAAAWQNQHQVNKGVRLEMADWLLSNETLTGKSRPEVVSMLGKPDGGTYWPEHDLAYYLGPERSLVSVDSEWLVIDLGSDGRVQEADIVRD